MSWLEELSASFPSPRPGEPERLRSDIADELADHLACALAHEERRVADETEAKRRVLDRFGDPRAVARKLWWDAMKGVVMKDRVVLGIVIVLALAVLASLGMSWKMYSGSQAVNVALLEQIKALSGQAEKPAHPQGWTPIRVHVAVGRKDGPPASGVRVQLVASVEKPGTQLNMFEDHKTNEDGLIEVAGPSPAAYSVHLEYRKPSGWTWSRNFENVIIGPGANFLEYVCPEEAVADASCSVEFRFSSPTLVESYALWVACDFEREAQDKSVTGWTVEYRREDQDVGGVPSSPLILNPSGEYGWCEPYRGQWDGPMKQRSARIGPWSPRGEGGIQPAQLVIPGHYRLTRVLVVALIDEQVGYFRDVAERVYPAADAPRFTLNAGNNVWTLPLPPESEIEAGLNLLQLEDIAPKVKTVQPEMRNLAVALESFRVFEGRLPTQREFYNATHRNDGVPATDPPIAHTLTSPVAHISALPGDPFHAPEKTYHYGYWTGNKKPDNPGYAFWILRSYGPDGESTADLAELGAYLLDRGAGRWEQKYLDRVYDPTNGVKSRGDIIKTGP